MSLQKRSLSAVDKTTSEALEPLFNGDFYLSNLLYRTDIKATYKQRFKHLKQSKDSPACDPRVFDHRLCLTSEVLIPDKSGKI